MGRKSDKEGIHVYICWSSNPLATSCEELTHWKRPWCWERLKAEGEGDNIGWDGCIASLTQPTWVWANSGRWWRTGKPDVLQSTGLQRVGCDSASEQRQNNANVPNVEQDGNLSLPNCAQVYLANLIIQKSTPSTHHWHDVAITTIHFLLRPSFSVIRLKNHYYPQKSSFQAVKMT